MKQNLLTILFMLPVFLAGAQQITESVISSGGESYSAQDYNLSWTVGETVIETFYADGLTLTQGFHQGSYTLTRIDENNNGKFEVNVFPNPAVNYVNIETFGEPKEMFASLYDMNGKVVRHQAFTTNALSLNISDLKEATYLLVITSTKGEKLAKFKLIKNQ
jgi:hypothetical protein